MLRRIDGEFIYLFIYGEHILGECINRLISSKSSKLYLLLQNELLSEELTQRLRDCTIQYLYR